MRADVRRLNELLMERSCRGAPATMCTAGESTGRKLAMRMLRRRWLIELFLLSNHKSLLCTTKTYVHANERRAVEDSDLGLRAR